MRLAITRTRILLQASPQQESFVADFDVCGWETPGGPAPTRILPSGLLLHEMDDDDGGDPPSHTSEHSTTEPDEVAVEMAVVPPAPAAGGPGAGASAAGAGDGKR